MYKQPKHLPTLYVRPLRSAAVFESGGAAAEDTASAAQVALLYRQIWELSMKVRFCTQSRSARRNQRILIPPYEGSNPPAPASQSPWLRLLAVGSEKPRHSAPL